MPFEFGPAIGAALLWALSAQVVNDGLARLKRAPATGGDGILVALALALACGFLVIWAISGLANPLGAVSWRVFAAGLLTFPIGTGLYYLCSVAWSGKAELASQFANVKPVMSIAIGTLLFGEALGARGAVTALLILLGVLLIVRRALREGKGAGQQSNRAILLGLALALSWSAGEAFIFSETGGASSLRITLGALASSLLVVLALLLGRGLARPALLAGLPRQAAALWPFAVHGVLSFGLAYGLFFHSIRQLGLSHTVMITVAWPILSFAIGYARSKMRGEAFPVDRTLLTAMLLFAVASLGYVLSGL